MSQKHSKAIEKQFFFVILIAICYCPLAACTHVHKNLIYFSSHFRLVYIMYKPRIVHNLTKSYIMCTDEKRFFIYSAAARRERYNMKFTAEMREMKLTMVVVTAVAGCSLRTLRNQIFFIFITIAYK
jgi:hypothetical protein